MDNDNTALSIDIRAKWTKRKALPNNLLNIGRLTENEIIHLLRARYDNDMIYTLMGNVQLAINPFKSINVAIETYTKCESKLSSIQELEPHAFQIAAISYHNLANTKSNQSVIIGGESGSGKTETTKLILKYLTNECGKEIADKLISSNPILESFGNAKTLRNNNSSRFGKWMTMFYQSNNYKLIGANITNYLLEKARISYQAEQERNYHIFYFMVKSAEKHSFLDQFRLKRACSEFRYLNGGNCVNVDGIDDIREFDVILNALKIFQFTKEETIDIFSILSGILHSGNITYQQLEDHAELKDRLSMRLSAQFLGLNVKQFEKHITTKVIKIRNQETAISLDLNGCINSRDSICKDIYDKLFNHLVKKINMVLSSENKDKLSKSSIIGVLDIFGFEIFDKNRFEQFCINYTNEKLQNHFQKYCWDREMKIYENEGIDISHIKFVNNDKTCSLISDPNDGIIRLIQDEITMPKGNDESLAMRLHHQHSSHPNYNLIKKNKLQFEIIHFAGTVRYEIDGFFAKNLDALTLSTKEMLQQSQLSLMKTLYSIPSQSTKNRGRKSSKCVATVFLKSLQRLIKSINCTKPHFIRCIKPNHDKKPGIWDENLIKRQLKYSGIFAYLELRRFGYDVQIPFQSFVMKIYYALRDDKDRKCIKRLISINCEWLKIAKALKPMLIKLYDLDDKDIQFGKTKIFIQNKNYRKLEFAASFWITAFQRKWRKAHQQRMEELRRKQEEERLRLEKEKAMEAERKKQEEELRKIEAERLRKQQEIKAGLIAIEAEREKEKQEIEMELAPKIKVIKAEFEKKEMDLIKNINIQPLDNEEMKAHDMELLAHLKSEIDALKNKQRSLKEELIRKVKDIKRLKAFAKKHKNRSDENKYEHDENDPNYVLNHKMGNIKDNMWLIGSIGEISEKGGSSFYVSENHKTNEFKGNLHRGDKILLLSKRGYFNKSNDNIMSAKVMIIKAKSGHFLHQIGFVKLTATSYYTKRSVYEF